MKLPDAIIVALLLAPAACRVVPPLSQPHIVANTTTLVKVSSTPPTIDNGPAFGGDSPPPAKRPKVTPVSPVIPVLPGDPESPAEPAPPVRSSNTEWDFYVCRGEKLTQASKLNKDKAEAFAFPISTPWHGTLEAERKLWGYTEDTYPDCDFEGEYYDITRAYKALNMLPEDQDDDDHSNDCFRVTHYDFEKVDEHGREVEVDAQTYKVDGKTYRMTGAHATFGINVEQGVLVFVDVASASLKAAAIWGVQKPPVDQLPALRQMSDLAWGFWHEAHGGSDLGHITKFIVTQVVNGITNRLIDQALQTYIVPNGQERLTAVPTWPGINFDIETEQGKALLGSPNGIAAAYFLSQHKPQIGANKYIHQITVFQPDFITDWPSIIYNVQDAPISSPEGQGDTYQPERKQYLTGRDLASNADMSPITGIPLAAAEPPPQTDWQRYVCRGKRLTQASKLDKAKAVQFASPIDSIWEGTMEAEIKLWGYKEISADSHCYFGDIESALKALKISMLTRSEGGPNYCYQVRHIDNDAQNAQGEKIADKDQTYKVNGKDYRMTGAYSIIGVNARSGVIYFVDVRSAWHAAEELWKPETPTDDALPALRSISDLSWAFWNRVHPKGRNIGRINQFIVHNIVNKETQRLIEQSLELYTVPDGQQRVTELPKWPGLTFDIETEAGQAMLGSPNGIAAGYFLSQHKTQLGGNKYIHQISLFTSEWGGEPSMILHVKEAPTPSPDNAGTTKKREQSDNLAGRDLLAGEPSPDVSEPSSVSVLAGDDSSWQRYVCRGEKLTQASMRNKDSAADFANPIDSEWDGTLEAELKLWGYTDYQGKSMYCELDNIADSLNQIGIDAKFKKNNNGQNECFYIRHRRTGETDPKDQVYQVGDKTYRMTDSYVHMGVNARDGVISFLNVRSAERSAVALWKVTKPAADDLPKLRQISDLAWAFWKRAHPDGTGLQNVNKFLVHDIVNDETLNLIRQALKTYKVPEGQQRYNSLPRWPGLVFAIETDEGKAMLGSPNGVAAGYFLAQHKTQLGGNKYVYQVSVWKDRYGDEQMMFWVKDAPPPEDDGIKTPTPAKDDANADGTVVKRSIEGRNLIREYIILAKL